MDLGNSYKIMKGNNRFFIRKRNFNSERGVLNLLDGRPETEEGIANALLYIGSTLQMWKSII